MKWMKAEVIVAETVSPVPPKRVVKAICEYVDEKLYYRLRRHGRRWTIYTSPGRRQAAPWWMRMLAEMVVDEEPITEGG